MRAPLAPALALLGAACVTGQAVGTAGTWQLPAVTLSAAGGAASNAQVASGPAGVATAVWRRSNGTHFIIQASRYLSGAWSAPVDLSAPGENAYAPQVAVDAAGVATVAWAREDGFNLVVQASRLAGGTWSAPVDVGAGTQPQVAAGPAGTAVVLFEYFDGTDWGVKASHWAGGWTTPDDVSARGPINANVGDVAMDPSGTATAVWQRDDAISGFLRIQAAQLTSGGWSTPVTLSTDGENSTNPTVTVDRSGVATTAWNQGGTGVGTARLQGGSWSAPQNLLPAGTWPHVAAGDGGEVTAVWSGFIGAEHAMQAARFTGGAWSAATGLYPLTTAAGYDPRVAALPAGGAVAMWSRARDGGYVAQASVFSGSSWGEPTDLSAQSPTATLPWVSADATGAATAVWQVSNGVHDVVQAARFIPSSPAPGPTAAAAPALEVLPSRRRLVSGQRMRVGVRVSNSGTAQAQGVVACIRVPSNLVVVRSPGFTRSGREACTAMGAVAAGAQQTRAITLRAVTARRVIRTLAATATADGVAIAPAAPRRVVITPRAPRVRVAG